LSEQTAERLQWPPRKEDLEVLYLGQRLSAMKISRVYGLKYPNPKSGESMVLWYLRKFGIKRRDPAEHVRKVTEGMVDVWVKRYQNGESLKQIAGETVDPVTVFNHLKRRGLKLRDKVEAQIKSVQKHEKKPFSGDPRERAYLMGFARGDLYVTRHGRAVRVKTSTTHPAMAQLFEELFKNHGPVYKYPRKHEWTGYEWSMDADLDSSFGFLLSIEPHDIERHIDDRNFLSLLGGFFDAEGSIYLHRKTSRFAPELIISNSNHSLVQRLANELMRIGIFCTTEYQRQKAGRSGIRVSGDIWQIRIWRINDVQRLLRLLPLRHQEKVAKARIALEIRQPLTSTQSAQAVDKWYQLLAKIKADRGRFLDEARILLGERARILAGTKE